MPHYLILIAGWTAYFFLHSWLAADAVKDFMRNQLGKNFRYYRLFYSTLSSIGLLALIVYNALLKSPYLFQPNNITRYVGLMVASFGVIVTRIAFKQYNLSSFIGLTPENENAFQTSGILQHVRHPLYTATILIVIGYFIFAPTLATLISCLCILVYLAIGIWLEERKLIKRFGDHYRTYKKQVPMLFPRIKK